MRLTEKIIKAIRESFDTLLFFLTMAVKENFFDYVGKVGALNMNKSRRLAILGNGPSLKQQLPKLIEQKEWEHADMMAVTMESFGMNIINSKLSYIFAAESKTIAESMKKLFAVALALLTLIAALSRQCLLTSLYSLKTGNRAGWTLRRTCSRTSSAWIFWKH